MAGCGLKVGILVGFSVIDGIEVGVDDILGPAVADGIKLGTDDGFCVGKEVGFIVDMLYRQRPSNSSIHSHDVPFRRQLFFAINC